MADHEPETITEALAPRPEPVSKEPGKRPLDVPFDVPGVHAPTFFCFGLGALEAFETLYGYGWFATVERGLIAGSPKMFRLCVDHGLKTAKDGKAVPLEIDLDDLPFAIGPAVEAILDALCKSHFGKGYGEMIKLATEAAEARAAEPIEEDVA